MRCSHTILLGVFLGFSPVFGAPVLQRSLTVRDMGPSVELQNTRRDLTPPYQRLGLTVAAAQGHHIMPITSRDHGIDETNKRGISPSDMGIGFGSEMIRAVVGGVGDLLYPKEDTAAQQTPHELGQRDPVDYSAIHGLHIGLAAAPLNSNFRTRGLTSNDGAIRERDLGLTGVIAGNDAMVGRGAVAVAEVSLMSVEEEHACRQLGNTPERDQKTGKWRCTDDPDLTRKVPDVYELPGV